MRQLALVVLDLFLIALSTIGALLLRDNFELTDSKLIALAPYLLLTLVVAAAVFPALGSSRSVWRLTTMADYLAILGATVATVLGAVALGFGVNRLEGVARALPVLQALLMLCSLIGVRVFARLRHAARQGPIQLAAKPGHHRTTQTVLLIGLNRLTELYLRSALEFARGRVVVAGVLGHSARHSGRAAHQHAVLGVPEQVKDVLRELEVRGVVVDRIVVTVPFSRLSRSAQEALLSLEQTTGLRVDLISELLGLDERARHDSRDAACALPSTEAVFAISRAELAGLARRPYWRVKRMVDVLACLCLIVVFAPVALVVAILVAVDLGLPVTFWQQRPGTAGRPFRLYKFRTMAAAHDRQGQRLSDEERLSAIGRFLRRTRLDELPQLYNVLVGDMSFIGPRPLLPIDQPAEYAARLLVRPGLTGWGQVKGGRAVSAADKAALDVWYVMNASFRLDATILLKTMRMVLFGERTNVAAIHRAWRELRQSGVCALPEPAEVPGGLVATKRV